MINLVLLFIVVFVAGLIVGWFFSFRSKTLLKHLQEELEKNAQSVLHKNLVETDQRFGEKSQERLNLILDPFKKDLKEFKDQAIQMNKESSIQSVVLKTSIENLDKTQKVLATEADKLTKALKGQVKIQGNWGEMILERALEFSGLRKGVHYKMQASVHIDNYPKSFRPDCLVYLPEGRPIIIDSKVTLNSYQDYFNAEQEEDKIKALKEVGASLQKHINDLGSKNYWAAEELKALDSVFLFIPIESLYILIANEHANLFEEAMKKRIYITSPLTLIYLMKVINSLWRVDTQNKNAQEMSDIAGKIYDKFVLMTEEIDNIEKRAHQIGKHISDFKIKISGRDNIVKNIQDLKEKGGNVSKNLSDNYLDLIDKS